MAWVWDVLSDAVGLIALSFVSSLLMFAVAIALAVLGAIWRKLRRRK